MESGSWGELDELMEWLVISSKSEIMRRIK
jgi:hypothetical protein